MSNYKEWLVDDYIYNNKNIFRVEGQEKTCQYTTILVQSFILVALSRRRPGTSVCCCRRRSFNSLLYL